MLQFNFLFNVLICTSFLGGWYGIYVCIWQPIVLQIWGCVCVCMYVFIVCSCPYISALPLWRVWFLTVESYSLQITAIVCSCTSGRLEVVLFYILIFITRQCFKVLLPLLLFSVHGSRCFLIHPNMNELLLRSLFYFIRLLSLWMTDSNLYLQPFISCMFPSLSASVFCGFMALIIKTHTFNIGKFFYVFFC